MVSGLGCAAESRRHGIAVLADLPGVGHHSSIMSRLGRLGDARARRPLVSLPFEVTMLLQARKACACPRHPLPLRPSRSREKRRQSPPRRRRAAVKASPNVARARSEGTSVSPRRHARQAHHRPATIFPIPMATTSRLLIRAMRFTRELGHTRAMQASLRGRIAPRT